MILALEGPDRCGKTSVFKELAKTERGVFVPSLSFPPELHHVRGLVCSRLAQLWELMYRREELYVCDRSLFVSGPVYAALYGAEFPYNWAKWTDECSVVYFDVPNLMLETRCRTTDEPFDLEECAELKALYWKYLKAFKRVLVVDGTRSPLDLAEEIAEWAL